jgi:hypothetical protein
MLIGFVVTEKALSPMVFDNIFCSMDISFFDGVIQFNVVSVRFIEKRRRSLFIAGEKKYLVGIEGVFFTHAD